MNKTTVVIPNYKGRDYIENCLDSLFSGTVVPEILVVDNASNDGSLPLIKEKYPQVKIRELGENRGFSGAVNEGIKESSAPYVLLLNNDTTVGPDMVENLEKAMEQDPEIFSAAAKMISMYCPDQLDGAGDFYSALGWAFARGKDKRTDRYNKPCRIFSTCAGAGIYRRSLFEKVGFFDENHFAYLEDTDIGYRANIYGYANKYVPSAIVYHAGSAVSGSRHNTFKVKLSARNNIYLIYKNMPFLQILINLPFLLAGCLIKLFFFAVKGLGGVYLSGLAEGIKLSCSGEGHRHKVRFSLRNLKNYIWIQGQLWINMVRRLF